MPSSASMFDCIVECPLGIDNYNRLIKDIEGLQSYIDHGYKFCYRPHYMEFRNIPLSHMLVEPSTLTGSWYLKPSYLVTSRCGCIDRFSIRTIQQPNWFVGTIIELAKIVFSIDMHVFLAVAFLRPVFSFRSCCNGYSYWRGLCRFKGRQRLSILNPKP